MYGRAFFALQLEFAEAGRWHAPCWSTRISTSGLAWDATLYNIAAYRRLFPESYLATAHVMPARYRHMPLWGQFLSRSGDVREHMARPFRERLGRQSSLEGLDHCFPFPVLALESSGLDFYRFHGV
jgi:hypothetical protein